VGQTRNVQGQEGGGVSQGGSRAEKRQRDAAQGRGVRVARDRDEEHPNNAEALLLEALSAATGMLPVDIARI